MASEGGEGGYPQVIFALHSLMTERYPWSFRANFLRAVRADHLLHARAIAHAAYGGLWHHPCGGDEWASLVSSALGSAISTLGRNSVSLLRAPSVHATVPPPPFAPARDPCSPFRGIVGECFFFVTNRVFQCRTPAAPESISGRGLNTATVSGRRRELSSLEN